MNYEKIYEQIISRRKIELFEGYTERHHIIPKCLGGTDEDENLVNLSAREHFIVHLLLVKMHPQNLKLLYAANLMSHYKKTNINNRIYSWLKEKINNSPGPNTGTTMSDLAKQKISEFNKGKVLSEESKQKISLKNKGRKFTEEHRKKLSEAKKGKTSKRINFKHSEETKKKMSAWKRSDKLKQRLSEVNKGKKLSEETKIKSETEPSGLNYSPNGKIS